MGGKESAGGKAVLFIVLVLVLLVGGGWAAAYFAAEDKLPHGTTAAGVDLGDRTSADAARALQQGLADRISRPITVVAGGVPVQVDPGEAGLSVDADATVAQAAAGRSWDPRELWDHYTDGGGLDPVVRLDTVKLAAIARQIDAKAGVRARNGSVRFVRGQVVTTDSQVGRSIDEAQLAEALRSAYLTTGDRRAEVPLHDVSPAVDDSEVDAAVTGFANPAMTGPVTLVFGKSPVTLAPWRLGRALTLVPDGDRLKPTVDAALLGRMVRKGIAADASAPVDATVRLVKGRPRVIPARQGVSFDPKVVAADLLRLVVQPEGRRRARVPATAAEPQVSTADAQALRITQRVSQFTTHFPYAAYRNVNIGRAAALIDGTILKPGETFSLNGAVGERTRANGFTDGWTIQDGVYRSDLGGGVSQLATTTFNAMFFAGLKDVEHKANSFYIDRYPVGRDATVAWPSLDLRFKNDTPYGVLIDAHVTPSTRSSSGSVTVAMYSTKYWDITTATGRRYDFTPYKTQRLTGNCADTPGADGFSIDVWRYFHKPGQTAVEKSEKLHTTYIPQDRVICN